MVWLVNGTGEVMIEIPSVSVDEVGDDTRCRRGDISPKELIQLHLMSKPAYCEVRLKLACIIFLFIHVSLISQVSVPRPKCAPSVSFRWRAFGIDILMRCMYRELILYCY